jgi:hypothetical protein
MGCNRPQNALCHPEILPHWSVRMKQQRRPMQMQRQLFYESQLNSNPNSLWLPNDREAELKAAIAELLLNLVLDSSQAATGGDYDE